MTTNMPLIIDGHNDTLLELHLSQGKRPFFSRADQGHLDLPRAQQGGLGGGFFAIFTPTNTAPDVSPLSLEESIEKSFELSLAPAIDQQYAQQFTIAMAARLFRLEAESEGRVKIVRKAEELAACLEQGIFAIIFHIEGAEAIEPGLDTLYVLHQAGLRSLGLVWSRPNIFAHGVPFKFPQSPDIGPGLTFAGEDLVKACNDLGILVDLSHLNEAGFWDVARLSTAPLVATHSGVYALCASARNLTDKQLDAIKESNGLVGVNFHVGFLREDGKNDANTPLADIARHAAYIADRIGVEHVALGSDFDGAIMPETLGDVTGLPRLMAALSQQGFDDADLKKIAHENWIRLLKQSWK